MNTTDVKPGQADTSAPKAAEKVAEVDKKDAEAKVVAAPKSE